MKKSILFILAAFIAIGVYGVSNLTETTVSHTETNPIKTSYADVTYSIEWNEYAKTYFIHFTNTGSHIYDISFEYYSETCGKYIDNALVLGKFTKNSACCGERKDIRNLTITQRKEE